MEHHQAGRLEEAERCYTQVLQLDSGNPDALHLLGVIAAQVGKNEIAVELIDKALAIKPEFAEALCNRGNALQELKRYEEAVASYDRALSIKSGIAEALSNRGNALKALKRYDEALASFDLALAIKPDYAEAHNNLGIALKDLDRFSEAEASYRRALEIKPDYAEAHSSLGNALKDLGRLAEAEASYRRALDVKPDYVEAHSYLLFVLNYADGHAPSYCLEEAREYGRRLNERVGARFSTWQCVARPERLRVGLVSGDFKNHPGGFFLEGLLAHSDAARVELIAYPTDHKTDDLTARIRPCFAAWKPLMGHSDEAAARLIQADGVHVLLDLSGHTAHNRLPVFGWKPAPVQASWLGYFATTGVAQMDYVLADAVGVPEADQGQFTETVWYLPETRLCFTAPKGELPVAPLLALAKGCITFGCFQNLAKVSDEVLAVWGKILAALPNAQLRLQCKQLGDAGVARRLVQRLQQQGIEPVRVAMHGPVQREAYLAAHAEVDLILDTFPYPGGTTTCEALWMGVPTLTLAGSRLLSRQGASLLTAAGLPDWVAQSEAQYVDKAIALARDLPKLAALRAALREQVLASPLFDAPRFARNFEQALWGMWRGWCDR